MLKLGFINKYLFKYLLPIILSIFLNFLSVIFSVLTFSTLYPFLQLLFDQIKVVEKPLPLSFSIETISSNSFYIFSEIIRIHGKSSVLFYISLCALILYFIKNFVTYMASYTLAPVRSGILQDIRNDLYNKLLILPLSFYRYHKKGDIISRTTNDVQEMDESILKPIQTLFFQTFTILFYIVALFFINYKLTLFVLVLLPIGSFIISRLSKKLKKASVKLQSKQGTILSQIEETIYGIRIIKAYNAIEFSYGKFVRNNQIYTKLKNIIYRRTDLASPLSEFLGTVLAMLTMIYGGILIFSNHSTLDGASFVLYLVLFINIINPAKSLTTSVYQIKRGKASIERIEYIFNAEEIIEDDKNPLLIDKFNQGIEFRNVSFSYNHNKYVLRDINLFIKKGQSVAIVGPTGAGKTTLIDLISRFYDCTEGEILLDEIPLKKIGIDSLRSLTGIVSQETILFNDTVFNNIAFGNPGISYEKVIESAKAANAHEFIMKLENQYQTNIGDRGSFLSGGQRQRISIARALLKNPPVLILDEATSSLDTESERIVQDALEKLMKGRTTIAIAHRLSTIYKMDEIIVLEQGKIIEKGNHNVLIQQNGLYKRLHDLQTFK